MSVTLGLQTMQKSQILSTFRSKLQFSSFTKIAIKENSGFYECQIKLQMFECVGKKDGGNHLTLYKCIPILLTQAQAVCVHNATI